MNLALMTFIVVISFNLAACKRPEPPALIELKPLLGIRDPEGIVDIEVSLSEDQVKVHWERDYGDAELVCTLNDEPLEPCQNPMEFILTAEDQYRLRVVVKKEDQMIAIGERVFQIGKVRDTQLGAKTTTSSQPLTLRLKNRDFLNGMALDFQKPYSFELEWTEAPKCTPRFRCRYGRINEDFRFACVLSDMKHDLVAGRMARGLQYLRIQALCDDQQGPELSLHWYGVPEDYQNLMIERVPLGKSAFDLRMVKQNDCPRSKVQYECQFRNQFGWDLCRPPFFEAQAKPTSARARCDRQRGPSLALQ